MVQRACDEAVDSATEHASLDCRMIDELKSEEFSQCLPTMGDECHGAVAQSTWQPDGTVSHASGNTHMIAYQSTAHIAESNLQKRQREYPNWREISDPEERRKQRRLAKNRATAARSRERKRIEVEGLQQQNATLSTFITQLQNQNQLLQQHCSGLEDQIVTLKGELLQIRNLVASHTSGATTTAPRAGPAVSKAKLSTLQLVIAAHLRLWRNRIFMTLFWMLTFWATILTWSSSWRFDEHVWKYSSTAFVYQLTYAYDDGQRIASLVGEKAQLRKLSQKEPS